MNVLEQVGAATIVAVTCTVIVGAGMLVIKVLAINAEIDDIREGNRLYEKGMDARYFNLIDRVKALEKGASHARE